ncbi:MAG: ribosomal L7Ae/L30e/S12e/Gadd45 family protein [Clostridia bacterium]|nr:ribosomal L7Ae/L30e/S12e/Gadd45 family protein [Clostridia bacterium]
MYEDLASAKSRVIGTKQTVRALERGCAMAVYVAMDAEERVIRGIKALCSSKGIPVIAVSSMDELGKVCGIDVGAASAAILRE